MDIGFIGLGNMGQPMARRLIEAGHKLIVYDTRNDAVAPLVALGAQLASSPADVADRVETVMASLPSLQISEKGCDRRGRRHSGQARSNAFVDLSTTGATVAAKIAAVLARKNIVQIDCPVSGGVGGAEQGHARRDGLGSESRNRSGERSAARGVRKSVRHRRKARHGADHEARQQFPFGHRDGGDAPRRWRWA